MFRFMLSAALVALVGPAAADESAARAFLSELHSVERAIGRAMATGDATTIKRQRSRLSQLLGRGSEIGREFADCSLSAQSLYNVTIAYERPKEPGAVDAAMRDARQFWAQMPKCEAKVGIRQERAFTE